jgi:hypothetical protein
MHERAADRVEPGEGLERDGTALPEHDESPKLRVVDPREPGFPDRTTRARPNEEMAAFDADRGRETGDEQGAVA